MYLGKSAFHKDLCTLYPTLLSASPVRKALLIFLTVSNVVRDRCLPHGLLRNWVSNKSLAIWFRSSVGLRKVSCPWLLVRNMCEWSHLIFKRAKSHFVRLNFLVYTNSKVRLIECKSTKLLCEQRGFFKVKYLRKAVNLMLPLAKHRAQKHVMVSETSLSTEAHFIFFLAWSLFDHSHVFV